MNNQADGMEAVEETADMTSFRERVSKERTQRGWTLRDLADKSGLALSRVHRIETQPGRKITIDDAISLADAFGMPVAWLMQGSQVRRRILAAARATNSEDTDKALDAVLPTLELAALLDDLRDTPPPEVTDAPALQRPRGTLTPDAWGAATAAEMRERWDLLLGPISDLAEVIEKHTDALVTVLPLPRAVDGLVITDPETNATVIAVNQDCPWERQRFTLAHELGHLIAGDQVIEAVEAGTSSPVETAASAFARHFLVPMEDLRVHSRDLQRRGAEWTKATVAEQAWRYRVSPAVVAIQLSRAQLAPGALVNDVSTRSAEAWSRLGGWEPQRQALAAAARTRRVPPALLDRALTTFTRGLIPASAIARLLDSDPATLMADLDDLDLAGARTRDLVAD